MSTYSSFASDAVRFRDPVPASRIEATSVDPVVDPRTYAIRPFRVSVAAVCTDARAMLAGASWIVKAMTVPRTRIIAGTEPLLVRVIAQMEDDAEPRRNSRIKSKFPLGGSPRQDQAWNSGAIPTRRSRLDLRWLKIGRRFRR